VPELDKESEEKDPLTDDWGWCEGETEQDLNKNNKSMNKSIIIHANMLKSKLHTQRKLKMLSY
jgi:hypothetical protein